MNNLLSIFRERENGFSDLTAFLFSEYYDFFQAFKKLVENRVNIGDPNFTLDDIENDVQISREFCIPNGRIDILISTQRYDLAIENKTNRRRELRKGQLIDYEKYLSSSDENKLKIIILLCRSTYIPEPSEIPNMLFCKISYREIRGILRQLFSLDESNNLFTKYDHYLGVIEMSPFNGFDLKNINYVLETSRNFRVSEEKMISDFNAALNSIVNDDNGDLYFKNFQSLSDKDRRWLNRPNYVGDYSKVIRLKNHDEYTFWLTFQFSETSISFIIYIFCPSDERASDLYKMLKKDSPLCKNWHNQLSISHNIEKSCFNNWNVLRNEIRNFINISFETIQKHI
jgi:hypothetical protein